jgi:acyl-CoA reductase-like NAD-dependent aldehyde dehydrogenase
MAVSLFHPASMLTTFHVLSDYFAALLRTTQAFVAPTQGKLLNYVHRVPLGVVAQITVSYGYGLCKFLLMILELKPFNHPLLIAVKKIAPALAAGNSVIVKPSEVSAYIVLNRRMLMQLDS